MTTRAILLTLSAVLAVATSCKSREPTPPGERPTIESLDPPENCFPRRQPDNRGNPPAATRPTTQATTSPT